jgi:hypothetical protein
VNHQEALDAIAAIVDHHVRGAAAWKTDPDDEMLAIRRIIDQVVTRPDQLPGAHSTPGALSYKAELDARYCPKCGHPNGYDRGEGCTMPVLEGTTTPIMRGERGERCGCTYGSGPAPAGPAPEKRS